MKTLKSITKFFIDLFRSPKKEEPKLKFGWVRDLPDTRDFKFKIDLPHELPPMVDLRAKFPPVYNQGELGSCTSNAIGGAFEYEQIKQGKPDFMPSRLFIYFNERAVEGTINTDGGAMIRTGIKTMVDLGVCPESMWPYITTKFTKKPDPGCYTVALEHQVTEYMRLSPHSLYEVKHCLSDGFPVVFGFTVFESLMSDEVKRTGIAPIPSPNESPMGGHAVCCLPNTMITTISGMIPIEDIEIGDMVLTHDGTFRQVLNTFSREINEEIYKISNNCGDTLCVTGEHPFYTKKYSTLTKLTQIENTNSFLNDIEWQNAENLQNGNLLYMPIPNQIITDDNVIYDEDFFELLGMYIGDGNINVRYSKNSNVKSMKLRFSLGKNYPELIERCKYLLEKYSKNSMGVDDFENHINLICYDTALSKKIGNICGFAKNKTIPPSILFAENNYQKSFLIGWHETDGCRIINTNIISTSEHNLYQGLVFILRRLKLLYSITVRPDHISIIKEKAYNCKESYHISICNIDENWTQIRTKHRSIYHDNYLIFKLNGIMKELYSGKVYNIEVEEKNSYVANGLAVHNCAVGYDDTKKALLVRNSWGSDWGLNGYFYLPYEFVTEPNMSADYWTIRMVE